MISLPTYIFNLLNDLNINENLFLNSLYMTALKFPPYFREGISSLEHSYSNVMEYAVDSDRCEHAVNSNIMEHAVNFLSFCCNEAIVSVFPCQLNGFIARQCRLLFYLKGPFDSKMVQKRANL